MRFIVIFEVIALLCLPFLMAILRKRGAKYERQMPFFLSTLYGLLMGTFSLYIRHPKTLFSFAFTEWLFALGIFLLSWIILYPLSRWLIKLFSKK